MLNMNKGKQNKMNKNIFIDKDIEKKFNKQNINAPHNILNITI